MLKGKSVYLRKMEPEDINLMVLWENDPENWKVSGIEKPYTYLELKAFVEEQEALQISQQARFIICTIENQEAIGTVDLFDVNFTHGHAGVGILIADAEDRKKGYASESLSLLSKFAQSELNLRNLVCSIHSDNIPSIRLFEKAGFEKIGVRKDWYIHNGIKIDELLFQLCLVK